MVPKPSCTSFIHLLLDLLFRLFPIGFLHSTRFATQSLYMSQPSYYLCFHNWYCVTYFKTLLAHNSLFSSSLLQFFSSQKWFLTFSPYNHCVDFFLSFGHIFGFQQYFRASIFPVTFAIPACSRILWLPRTHIFF